MKCSDKEWQHCNKEKMGCEGCFYNDEISIGEYVRTYNNGIKRIDTIWENKTVNKYGYEVGNEWDGKLYSIIKTTDIVKHSKDITDLIEEGDYVNGCQVMGIYVPRDTWEPIQINVDSQTIKYFIQDEIKSIITKEQIKQIEFRIKE